MNHGVCKWYQATVEGGYVIGWTLNEICVFVSKLRS